MHIQTTARGDALWMACGASEDDRASTASAVGVQVEAGDHRLWLATSDMAGGVDPVRAAMTAGDVEALMRLDDEIVPFYCRECGASYCEAHWTTWSVMDPDDPSWFDELRVDAPWATNAGSTTRLGARARCLRLGPALVAPGPGATSRPKTPVVQYGTTSVPASFVTVTLPRICAHGEVASHPDRDLVGGPAIAKGRDASPSARRHLRPDGQLTLPEPAMAMSGWAKKRDVPGSPFDMPQRSLRSAP